jgi:outer membrane phospholipase A
MWARIEEDRCPIGEDGQELEYCRDKSGYDDNPDLTDYMGYAELHYRYRWTKGKRPKDFHVMVRGNLAAGKGGIAVDYSHAASSRDLHWFARAWHGYGESLIDYDRSITRVGLGLVFRRTFERDPCAGCDEAGAEPAPEG